MYAGLVLCELKCVNYHKHTFHVVCSMFISCIVFLALFCYECCITQQTLCMLHCMGFIVMKVFRYESECIGILAAGPLALMDAAGVLLYMSSAGQ